MSSNPFIQKKDDKPVFNPTVYDTDYVYFKPVKKVKKTGEGDEDFVVVTEFVEQRVPIREVVNVDKDNVGLKNILKKFAITGDESLLPPAPSGVEVDTTSYPDNLAESLIFIKRMQESYDALPEDLRSKYSMEDLIHTFQTGDLTAYIEGLMPKGEENHE